MLNNKVLGLSYWTFIFLACCDPAWIVCSCWVLKSLGMLCDWLIWFLVWLFCEDCEFLDIKLQELSDRFCSGKKTRISKFMDQILNDLYLQGLNTYKSQRKPDFKWLLWLIALFLLLIILFGCFSLLVLRCFSLFFISYAIGWFGLFFGLICNKLKD